MYAGIINYNHQNFREKNRIKQMILGQCKTPENFPWIINTRIPLKTLRKLRPNKSITDLSASSTLIVFKACQKKEFFLLVIILSLDFLVSDHNEWSAYTYIEELKISTNCKTIFKVKWKHNARYGFNKSFFNTKLIIMKLDHHKR